MSSRRGRIAACSIDDAVGRIELDDGEEIRSAMRLPTALAVLLAGCTASGSPPSGPPAVWEPVEAAFEGCGGGCGGRLDHAEPGIAIQPGAEMGSTAFCPVSGVAFVVGAEHPHRELGGGRTMYFCCEGCAAYFDAHRAEVLAARGIDDAS